MVSNYAFCYSFICHVAKSFQLQTLEHPRNKQKRKKREAASFDCLFRFCRLRQEPMTINKHETAHALRREPLAYLFSRRKIWRILQNRE